MRIVLMDKNGITLKTENTIVEEDIEIGLDESLINEEYDGSFEGNAELVKSHTVTVSFKALEGSYNNITNTYIKINSLPTSASDYDALSYVDITGTSKTFTKVEKVYIWGYSYILNGTNYLLNNTYEECVEIEITEDCTIELLLLYIQSGGGSN